MLGIRMNFACSAEVLRFVRSIFGLFIHGLVALDDDQTESCVYLLHLVIGAVDTFSSKLVLCQLRF
jgi:hypothetical protein